MQEPVPRPFALHCQESPGFRAERPRQELLDPGDDTQPDDGPLSPCHARRNGFQERIRHPGHKKREAPGIQVLRLCLQYGGRPIIQPPAPQMRRRRDWHRNPLPKSFCRCRLPKHPFQPGAYAREGLRVLMPYP